MSNTELALRKIADKVFGVIMEEVRSLEKEEESQSDPYPDPYLQPGCPCEVWNSTDDRVIRRFSYMREEIGFFYDTTKNGRPNGWHHYRPIGTEWDFAPDWADTAEISKYGQIAWTKIMCPQTLIKTVLPKEYWNTTIPRPEWARKET